MKKLYPTAVLVATIGVGVQANELNITNPEVCGNGSLAASVEAVKSTDGNPWREARAELAASASGEVALEVADPSVKADFDHPAFQAWGTTFNELDLDALRMLTEDEQKEILDRAFLPDGELRFTRGRLTMNANDYSRAWYSCDEVDGDFDLKHFNIEHDKTNALVYVKWALARQPEMKFFVSPWSPPEWMKINHRYDVPRDESLYADPSDSKCPDEQGWPQRLATRDGMIQDPRYLTAYAKMFSRFIDLYAAEGVTIDRVMYQNEPYSYVWYPGCAWTATATIRFNRDYLAPELKKSHPEVQLGLGTLNTNRRGYVRQMLDGLDGCCTILGLQWEGLQLAEDMRREYKLPFFCTESECGNGSMDWKAAEHTAWLIFENLGKGAVEWYNWNLVLCDSGTSGWGWNQNALVRVDSKTKTYRYNGEWQTVRHFARYIEPGAVLLGWSRWRDQTETIAYRNPDGTLVVVAGNWSERARKMSVRLGSKWLNFEMEPHSFETCVVR